MTLPNFLIIGAAKAGTTSLYYYLKQHPGIYMSPEKEPRFFAFEGDTSGRYPYTTISQYEKLFNAVREEIAIGEASTVYLYSEDASGRIRARAPHMKLVAVLRNPIDRVYSNFIYWRGEGKEFESDFRTVVNRELEKFRKEGNDAYFARGLYGLQLQRYYDAFPREQIRVYLYEDLRDRPQELLRDLYAFLGVDPEFLPDLSQNYNVSALPDSRIKHLLYTRLMGAENVRKLLLRILPERVYWNVVLPAVKSVAGMLRGKGEAAKVAPMAPETRTQLMEFYRSDIELTERLIDRDLSKWLER